MVVPTPNNLVPRPPYRVIDNESSAVSTAESNETHSTNEDISLHDHPCETQTFHLCEYLLHYWRNCIDNRLFISLWKGNLRTREKKEYTTMKKDVPASGGRKMTKQEDKQDAKRLRVPFVILCQVLSTLLSSVTFSVFRQLIWKFNDYSDEETIKEHCGDQLFKIIQDLVFNKNGTGKLGHSEKEQVVKKRSGCFHGLENNSYQESICEKHVKDPQNYWNVPNNENRGFPTGDSDSMDWLFTSRQFRPVGVLAVVYPVDRQEKPDKAPATGVNQQAPIDTVASVLPSNRYKLPDIINNMPRAMFSQELHRLGTFYNLPSDSPVFAIRLAHVGFLRLPDGAIVCYFCELRHDEWHAGDSPFEVHRQLSPSCPITTGQANGNQRVHVLSLKELRQVMEVWSLSSPLVPPKDQSQQATAAGRMASILLATPSGARVTPAVSQGLPPVSEGSSSASNTAPSNASVPLPAAVSTATVATSHHPVPPFQTAQIMEDTDGPSSRTSMSGRSGENNAPTTSVTVSGGMSLGPILDGTAQPLPPTTNINDPSPSSATEGSEPRPGHQQQVVTYQHLGIVTEAPKRADMATLGARIESFDNWRSRSHTPQQMAQAGFFYAGYDDCARCFYCGGGLKSWERGDSPWVEHARWFKTCPYVRQCQGQDFIDVVQTLNIDGHQISMNQVREAIEARRAEGERLQELVVDPAVSSLVESGVRRRAVDSAVRRAQAEGQVVTANQLVTYLQADDMMPPLDEDIAHSISDNGLQDEVEQLVTENSEIRQQRMCKVCLDKESCIVFLPCGHLVCCAECSPVLQQCAMCRIRIKGRVRAFPGRV